MLFRRKLFAVPPPSASVLEGLAASYSFAELEAPPSPSDLCPRLRLYLHEQACLCEVLDVQPTRIRKEEVEKHGLN